jgi:acetyl-CoA carboxylase biotin carboxyl carrier protein
LNVEGETMATLKIKSDITGTVSKVVVQVGAEVAEDDTLLLLESMKMEFPVVAPRAGRVAQIHAAEGQNVAEDDLLVTLDT